MPDNPKINDGGSAFPWTEGPGFDESGCYFYSGMTLRQWYAGKALQGMLSSHTFRMGDINATILAKDCLAMADAMIAHEKDGK